MAPLFVFAIAFGLGCLSGVILALWSLRRRDEKPKRALSLWSLTRDESDPARSAPPR